MPTSYPQNISLIVGIIMKLKPKSILDVGPGFGKYGLLSREYLEIWTFNDFRKKNWKTRIDAVEAFRDYLTPVHKYVYNNIYVGDAQKITPKLKNDYDVVLLIDVLEHFAKNDGRALIKKLQKKSKNILVAIPKQPGKQKDAFGNKYETHKSVWLKKELIEVGAQNFFNSKKSWVCLIR